MDVLGDILYNLYGSTEVAYATIATPAGHARGAGHGRPPAHRHDHHPVRRRRQAGRRQRTRAGSSSASSMQFEGYTGGGSKEMVDGHDVDRRRRALRRRRPAVRRRPRRRHDRLRRRERLPGRGRGPARVGRRRVRGRGARASTTRSTASGCAPTWSRATARRSTRTSLKDHVKKRTWPGTRCRARSCSSTRCRATPPARS